MAKRKEDEPPKGAPAWQSTFADLMNLLLCFFVLLFSMSTVDAQKFELIAASFSETFSIFTAGSTAIGDGMLIGNGVSQLNQLDNYVYSTGKAAENDETTDKLDEMQQKLEEASLSQMEELAERVQEAISEGQLDSNIDVDFTSQYVELTLKGSLLFDSGSAVLKDESLPALAQVGIILERYADNTIEILGHTDNVPMSSDRYANNNELSSARALSVFDYLVGNTSLNPADIIHAGRGEYVPVADNSTPEGRSKNRRVEIRLYNTLETN
ncbi:MAG: flagellar motor protein MotB [Lachnospiraceae bacterium]|nr:flagellar motor protein MotB [Lachnospiraceae bacterium]